ncbi:MAG: proton-conducting transporter membrane subunit, partial [Anaerolineaceae bacterium]
MTLQDIIHLLPLLVLAVTMVIAMLGIVIWPRHQTAFWFTLSGLIVSLIALPIASRSLPRQITVLFVMDGFAVFYMALILAGGLVTTALSYAYMKKFTGNRGEYFLLLLVATFGSALLVMSRHFVSFFLGAGILSLSLFALIGYNPLQRQRIEAAIKYLILVGVASAVLLFGMALIYAEVGSMQFDQITAPLSQTDQASALLKIGFGLLIAGISFELALVPFHMWTPDVYEGAPAPVTGFIATVAKAGIFALMLRLFSYVYMPA